MLYINIFNILTSDFELRGFKNIISNVIKLLRRQDTDLSTAPLELLNKKCKKN